MKRLELPEGAMLAPMAGVTDYAFREVCAALGAKAVVRVRTNNRRGKKIFENN